MKKIFLLIFILASLQSFGQGVRSKPIYITALIDGEFKTLQVINTPITGYTKINARYEWIAGIMNGGFHVPQYNGIPSGVRSGVWSASGAIAVDTINHRLYFYSGGSWRYSTASTGGGGSTPTWQQTLTAGSTLTGNNTITAGNTNFIWNGLNYWEMNQGTSTTQGQNLTMDYAYFRNRVYNTNGSAASYNDIGSYENNLEFSVIKGGKNSYMRIFNDSIDFVLNNTSSKLKIENLAGGGSTPDSIMVYNPSTFQVKYKNASSLTVPISSLTAATGANSLDIGNYPQTWTANTLGSNNAFTLSSSTTAGGAGHRILLISLTGANATSSITSYGAYIQNQHSGTSPTNYGAYITAGGGSATSINTAVVGIASGNAVTNTGGYFIATNATNNYAIIVPASSGSVGIGTSTPTSLLHVVPIQTTGIGVAVASSTTTSGSIVDITGTSTALAAGNEGLNIGISGANGTNGITATGARISVTNTNATSGTNVGLDITASGATTQNTALNVSAGDVLIAGMGNFADTTNFKPVVINTTGTAGTSNKLYKATYWPGGGSSGLTIGTTTIASSVTGSILYDSSGVLSRNDNFYWDRTNIRLGISTNSPDRSILVKKNSTGSTLDVIPTISVQNTHVSSGASDYSFSSFELSGGNEAVIGEFFADGSGYFNSGTANLYFRTKTSSPILFGVNSSEAMRISSSGYLGIGITSPTARLHLPAGTASANTAPLKFTTGTSLTTAEVGAMEYTNPQLFFTNGGGVRQELFQGTHNFVQTQFDKTSSTTLGDVTNLTANVAAGKAYRFEAILYTTSNVAGGVKAAIAGTATATTIIYEGLTTDAGLTTQSRATSLGTAVGAVTAVTAGYIKITGTIIVNAAGTLTVQFAQNASNGAASSVLVGSTFVVIELPYFP